MTTARLQKVRDVVEACAEGRIFAVEAMVRISNIVRPTSAPEGEAPVAAAAVYVFWSENGENIRLWTSSRQRADEFAAETGLAFTAWIPAAPPAPKAATPPAVVELTDARAAFEAWFEGAALSRGSEHSNWFRRNDEGEYELDHVDWAWDGWKAAAALKTTPGG